MGERHGEDAHHDHAARVLVSPRGKRQFESKRVYPRNLDAFQNNSSDILSHHLQVAADKVIEIDSNQVPTGGFINVTGTPLDFTQEQTINVKWNDTFDLCGPGAYAVCACGGSGLTGSMLRLPGIR